MKALETLERVAGKVAPGPLPSFIEAHILMALETISLRAVGRARLSTILGLGEGVTRTLIRHLKAEGLIEVSRLGITLSESGRRVLEEIRSKISSGLKVPKSPLTVGTHNVAVLVKGASKPVRYGVEQRDAAIKVGAEGATTLIFKDNRLVLPGVDEEALQDVESIYRILISNLKPEENDVIIIGSAKDERTAELAAKTAALKLTKCSLEE
ncbi:MAG: hypothetical protein AYL32_009440 [Candidatus Bathyarchaeota archaeon B26-2]|nr:MAG: hypothetical protein AYL32_009440 [Candidatus Bathyarchaeota archaeon B26-2]